MSERCANCRHWGTRPVTPTSLLHRCHRIPLLRVDRDRLERGHRAVVKVDQERFIRDCGIELLTDPSFGCTEFSLMQSAPGVRE